MIDITHKIETLRIAVAKAELRVSSNSILAVRNNSVPKGDVFNSARIAALLAVKNTSNVLPHCHPLPVEFTDIQFSIKNKNTIEIIVEVKTIYKTGCEMEALHGAAVAALTAYDMIKPVDKSIEIKSIILLKKSGGKSGLKFYHDIKIKASVLVISDSVYAKKNKDESGAFIREKLISFKNINVKYFDIVNDEAAGIRNKVKDYCKKNIDLIITTGGTGFSKRDVTINAIKPLLDEEAEGIMEFARAYGQKRMPYAMLSKGIAGFTGETLVLTFPGSLNAAKEYMDSLFPYVLHLFKVRKGFKH